MVCGREARLMTWFSSLLESPGQFTNSHVFRRVQVLFRKTSRAPPLARKIDQAI